MMPECLSEPLASFFYLMRQPYSDYSDVSGLVRRGPHLSVDGLGQVWSKVATTLVGWGLSLLVD